MFAQVYPIVRLPRRFGFFDYEIPADQKVGVGDLVQIRFHGRLIPGIVKSVSLNTSVEKTIPIDSLLTTSFVQLADIARFETIAEATIQSPSSILLAVFQGIAARNAFSWNQNLQTPSLSFEKELTIEIQKFIEHIFSDVLKGHQKFIQTSWEGSVLIAHLVRRKTEGQVLILVPTEREAEVLLRKTAFPQTAVMHGKTKQNVRKTIIKDWRVGNIQTLITTRQGALVPTHKLGSVLILDVGSDDYLVTDRNPRIDVRLCAELLAAQHQARFILCGVAPRTEEIPSSSTLTMTETNFSFIDLTRKEEQTGHALISESLRKATEETLQKGKKALWFANRKGGAKRLQCAHCGYIPRCGVCHSFPVPRVDDLQCPLCLTEMWTPQECPSCHSKRLKTSGVGIERIAKSAQTLFPKAKIAICDKGRAPDPTADIQLVTEAYFAGFILPFQERTFGLVADVCLEHHLLASDYRSPESALRKLNRLAYFAQHQRAVCLVQTVDANRAEPMKHPEAFLKAELETRVQYNLPPSTWLWRTDDNIYTAKTSEEARQTALTLQSLPDSAIIQPELPTYGPFRSQPSE